MLFRRKHIPAVFVLLAALLPGCSLVDEDNTDCVSTLEVDCQLRLVTNIEAELQSRLGAPSQQEVRDLLHGYLDGCFAGTASDIRLSFFDARDAALPLSLEREDQFSGSDQVYRLDLPVSEYRNLSIANLRAEGGSVALKKGDQAAAACLEQGVTEGFSQPHGTALFAGRKDLVVPYGVSLRQEVPLYMTNCASALVVDVSGAGEAVSGLSVVVDGMATGFSLSDSSYVYDPAALMKTRELVTVDGNTHCFASIHFPSRPAVKAGESLWCWKAYATMPDGTINESILQLSEPLGPGQLKVLTARLTDTGVVLTEDTRVTVSITLDWGAGLDFPVPL